MLGTVQYMAPEQLEGRAADTRSDLFAFGAVLYEMLTGRRAFDGESTSKIIAAVLDSEPCRWWKRSRWRPLFSSTSSRHAWRRTRTSAGKARRT